MRDIVYMLLLKDFEEEDVLNLLVMILDILVFLLYFFIRLLL